MLNRDSLSKMQRSPPGTYEKLCASNPDLPTATASPLTNNDVFVNLRKRKQHNLDDEVLIMAETRINEHLSAWKDRLDATIADSIKNAVNVILEAEISRLSTTINQTLKQFSQQLDDIQESINYVNNRQDLFENRLKLVEESSASTGTIPGQIASLENKIEQMEQQARQFNLEISNLPEHRGENLILLLGKIGTIIKHPISSTDIVSAHRVPHIDSKNPHPKNVIVKLTSKILRDNIITAAKAFKGIKSDMVMTSGTPRTIYLNEHLTPKNKLLFRLCRDAAKKHNFKYVWVKHGTVLVRQTDSSPIFAVRTEHEVDKIKS